MSECFFCATTQRPLGAIYNEAACLHCWDVLHAIELREFAGVLAAVRRGEKDAAGRAWLEMYDEGTVH